jgi:hypothetical protein
MATRCSIEIEGINFAKVYMHWDGYPEHMMPFLEKFNKEFTEKRGSDPEYKFAQFIRATERMKEEFELDSSTETGYGVIPFHSKVDVNYNYILHEDGSVSFENR